MSLSLSLSYSQFLSVPPIIFANAFGNRFQVLFDFRIFHIPEERFHIHISNLYLFDCNEINKVSSQNIYLVHNMLHAVLTRLLLLCPHHHFFYTSHCH